MHGVAYCSTPCVKFSIRLVPRLLYWLSTLDQPEKHYSLFFCSVSDATKSSTILTLVNPSALTAPRAVVSTNLSRSRSRWRWPTWRRRTRRWRRSWGASRSRKRKRCRSRHPLKRRCPLSRLRLRRWKLGFLIVCKVVGVRRHVPIRPPVRPYAGLSVKPSVWLSVFLPVCISASLSVCQSFHLWICLVAK